MSELRGGGRGEVLQLHRVSKSYPGVRALSHVDFTCRSGEIHAIVGENGSGKSTLIKVASGVVGPDEGSVTVGGSRLTRPSPRASRELGLLTAYQDTSLLLELSVAENLLLSYPGVRPVPRFVRSARAAELLDRYDLGLRLGARVGELSPAARQLLEVVKALVHDPKVLLLDEPTAALDAATIEVLTELLQDARRSGMGIVYISHRLDEVERLADRITVLRDGAVQGSYGDAKWSASEILDLMVGVPIDTEFPPLPEVSGGAAVVLDVAELQARGFGPASLSVRAGEIVGLAAAEGNGQRELLRTLAGLQRSRGGSVRINGVERALKTPRQAVEAGVQLISGDRATEAAFAGLGVMQNATLAIVDDLGPLKSVMRAREQSRFKPVASRLRIAHASPDQPIAELSGGNQQKAVLARSVLRPGKVVLFDEPTMGIDARARLDIYRAINEEARNGGAVLICSSDSGELAGLCNRVYAMSRGEVVGELTGEALTETEIVRAFVSPRAAGGSVRRRSNPAEERPSIVGGGQLGPSWGPLVLVGLLILAIGIYTTTKSSVFLSQSNFNNLLVGVLPIGVVALGEQFCLITGGFDISVGSTMSLAVVVASFLAGSDSAVGAVGGAVVVLLIGIAVGVFNGMLIRLLKINALIGTIATLGILQGIAIALRPTETGTIGQGLGALLQTQISFVPYAFVVLALVAVAGDAWLVKTSSGLFTRAGGHAESMSYRNGIRVGTIKFGGYIVSGGLAALAGLFLSVQVGVGASTAGSSYALPAFAACFIGGAGLSGGRGSFVGALLGAFFLALLTNVAPLVNVPSATTQIITGVLTIMAIVAYSVDTDTAVGTAFRFLRQRGEGARRPVSEGAA